MPSKIKKYFIGLLTLLFLLIAVILAVRAVWNYAEGKKLSAVLEKAKADGVPLSMKELVLNCPESQNAAALWKASWALLPTDNPSKSVLNQAVQEMFDGRLPEGESRAVLADLIKKNQLVFGLMTEASNRSCLYFQDWSRPAYEAEFGNAVSLLISMKLLAIDAAFLAGDGDVEGALNRCAAGLRLARMMTDEPFLLNGLIAVADTKICLIAARMILNGREIAPGVLSEWIRELDPLSWRARFARVIPGERAYSLETGLALLRGNAKALGAHRFWNWLTRPMLKAQVRLGQGIYEGLEKIAGEPYFAQAAFHENFMRMIEAMPERKWLLKMLLPNYQTAFLKEAALESIMMTMRTGLACKLYKNKTGRYPENLEALLPEYLTEIPVDPFTGQPLVYKIENGRLLIYSLGSNGKDDGGQSTYLIEKVVTEKDDDWTWEEKTQS
jgi:hypothetical protein